MLLTALRKRHDPSLLPAWAWARLGTLHIASAYAYGGEPEIWITRCRLHEGARVSGHNGTLRRAVFRERDIRSVERLTNETLCTRAKHAR